MFTIDSDSEEVEVNVDVSHRLDAASSVESGESDKDVNLGFNWKKRLG